jgi:hypothetical protein
LMVRMPFFSSRESNNTFKTQEECFSESDWLSLFCIDLSFFKFIIYPFLKKVNFTYFITKKMNKKIIKDRSYGSIFLSSDDFIKFLKGKTFISFSVI